LDIADAFALKDLGLGYHVAVQVVLDQPVFAVHLYMEALAQGGKPGVVEKLRDVHQLFEPRG